MNAVRAPRFLVSINLGDFGVRSCSSHRHFKDVIGPTVALSGHKSVLQLEDVFVFAASLAVGV